jgi:hypothetical protein
VPPPINRNRHEVDLEAKLIHTLSQGEQPGPQLIKYEDGCWEDSVPVLAIEYTPHNKHSWASSLIITLNFFVPGTGTIYAAFLTESRVVNCKAVLCGCLQLLTAIVLIGFLWSWWWGPRIIHKSDYFHRTQVIKRHEILTQLVKKKSLQDLNE